MKESKNTIEMIDGSLACGEYDQAVVIAAKLHQRKVFSHLYLLSKNYELAKDLTQETFIKALTALREGRYKAKGQFASWLVRIAHNLFIDVTRRNKNINTVRFDNDDVRSVAFGPSKDLDWITSQINEEISSEVRSLLDCLPDEQKTVVIMRMYFRMSFREIAIETNVSINTALSRMRYALINLRRVARERNLDLSAVQCAA